MIVVVFRPHTLKAFLDLPVYLLHNQEVSGYDLENKSLKRLAAQVFDCENTSLCINIIERWLFSQIAEASALKTAYNIQRMTAAIERLFITPAIPVTELASIACLGKKQFERLFHETVGANPKEYARIVRFQKSLKLLQHSSGHANQAQLACQCGYADQSHFIREFKQFSGHTPLSLPNVCKPYSDLFNSPV